MTTQSTRPWLTAVDPPPPDNDSSRPRRPAGIDIPVAVDCSVSVLATGPLTRAGIDRLIRYLELVREWFP